MNKSKRVADIIANDYDKAKHVIYVRRTSLGNHAYHYFKDHGYHRYAREILHYDYCFRRCRVCFDKLNFWAIRWLYDRHDPDRAIYWERKARKYLDVAPVKYRRYYHRRGSHSPMHLEYQDPDGIKLTPNDWKMIYQIIADNGGKPKDDRQ